MDIPPPQFHKGTITDLSRFFSRHPELSREQREAIAREPLRRNRQTPSSNLLQHATNPQHSSSINQGRHQPPARWYIYPNATDPHTFVFLSFGHGPIGSF